MKKRFIVLIDFSEYSSNLLKYVYEWSKRVDGAILLVHKFDFVISARLDKEMSAAIVKETIAEKTDKLKEFSKAIIPGNEDVSFVTTQFNLHTEISELLAEPFENLLFVGLKGTGPLKKIFMGSVAVDVVEHTKDTPVVAIPKDVSEFKPERIFVAVREEYPLNIPALNSLLDFFVDIDPVVTFFTITAHNEETDHAENQLSELSNRFGDRCKTSFLIYKGDHIFNDIKKLINNNKKELLIVQKGSRLLIDKLFRKFMINELIYDGKIPLVVLP